MLEACLRWHDHDYETCSGVSKRQADERFLRCLSMASISTLPEQPPAWVDELPGWWMRTLNALSLSAEAVVLLAPAFDCSSYAACEESCVHL